MVSPAEHSKTEEDDDRVDESPPDAAASQPDSDKELAKLEDRWRRAVADLDNLRKRYARELDRERTTERSRVAGAWLPIVDNLERAIAHTSDQSDAVVEGVRSILNKRDRCSSSSAIRAMRRQGCPSTRSVTRWSVWWTTRTARPGRLSKYFDRATGKARASCGRRPWWSADARSDIGWPATT